MLVGVEPWNKVEKISTLAQSGKAWSACPNCLTDLRTKALADKRLYNSCPICGVTLTFVWWQRVLITLGALALAYGVPVALGERGLLLMLLALLCYWPALVVAMFIFVRIIVPKYVQKREAVMTLFRDR